MSRSSATLLPTTAVVVASAIGVMCLLGPSAAVAAPDTVTGTSSPSQWMPIGPNGQAGAIALAPGDDGRAVLIPSYGVSPWLTDDAGATWRQLPDPPELRNLGDTNRMVIDPSDSTHWWYAGTTIGTAESVVLETHDSGRTWTETARFSGELLAFSSSGGKSPFVLATSTGATTAAIHTGAGAGAWTTQAVDTGERIRDIVLSGDALILSGYFAAWRLDSPGSGSEPVEIYRVSASTQRSVEKELSANPTDAQTGDEDVNQIWDVATTDSAILVKELGRGLVGSTDAGDSWADWQAPHEVSSISSSGDAFYLVRSGPAPRWADVTVDAGATFTSLRIPDDGAIDHEFTEWADGSLTSANPRSGLYRTTDDGKQWERVGVQGTSGLDLLVHEGRLFAGTEYGLATTQIPAASHEWGMTGGEARVGTTTAELASAGEGQLIWKAVNAAFDELDVYSSADAGETWQERTNVFGVARGLTVHPADPNTVILTWQLASRCGLHISHDGGKTWSTSLGECFDAVVGDPRDPDRVWFGGPAGLFRSDDGGTTGVRVSDIPATTILLDKQRIVIGGTALHVSDDDGATFTQSTVSGSPSLPMESVEFTSLVRSGPRMFAGFTTGANTADSGIVVSLDGGRTWADTATGLQNSEVLSLAVSSDGDTLFAGTRNGGVHSTALPPRIAPTGAADTGHAPFGTPVSIDVLANDSGGDLDIDPTTVFLRSPEDGAWSTSLPMNGLGEFSVDPVNGSVTFRPDASFHGTMMPVTYRFANTDGETAQAELTIVVDSPIDPGDGTDPGSGDRPSTTSPSTGFLASTGADPAIILATAAALLAAGATLALRALLRRRASRQSVIER